jgi:hypothetical protein
MVTEKDKEDITAFITGLSDYYLKEFYKSTIRELKIRNMFDRAGRCLKNENKLTQFVTLDKPKIENNGLIIGERGSAICKVGFYPLKNKGIRNCIIDFLMEDWRFLFPNADNKNKDYYVYCHTDPTEPGLHIIKNNIEFFMYGKPFYIGKGKGDRYKSMHGRCTAHQNKVKDLILHGVESEKIFNVIQDGLTELEALELESKLITYFGTSGEYGTSRKYLTKYDGGILLNSDVAKRPKWINEIILHISSKYHANKSRSLKKRIANGSIGGVYATS